MREGGRPNKLILGGRGHIRNSEDSDSGNDASISLRDIVNQGRKAVPIGEGPGVLVTRHLLNERFG